MRRVFPILLLLAVTPLLVNCSDEATPVVPAGAVHSEGHVPTEEDWPTEENWWTPGDVLALVEEEMVVQAAGAPTPAVMELGRLDKTEDAARRQMEPHTVVINAGETVTFKVNPAHRLAIYGDGMKHTDIQPTPGFYLLYPVNRLFLQPFPAPQFTLRFVKPGKYLVICAINSHFFGNGMWGWVHVK
jgi:plastocyanin